MTKPYETRFQFIGKPISVRNMLNANPIIKKIVQHSNKSRIVLTVLCHFSFQLSKKKEVAVCMFVVITSPIINLL